MPDSPNDADALAALKAQLAALQARLAPETIPGQPTRLSPVTVANAANNARLATVAPADSGWTPSTWARLGIALGIGVLPAVGAALAAATITPATIIAAVFTGLAAGLATFAGLSSAGSASASKQ